MPLREPGLDVQHLLRISSRFSSERTPEGIAAATCEGICEALGFERVAVLLRDGDDLVTAAAENWPGGAPQERLPLTDLDQLRVPELHTEGCLLLTREEAHARTPEHLHRLYSSRRNGRGPHGWDHHWLLVPLHDEDGRPHAPSPAPG